ncbi:MAG: hypothetical protein ACK4IY_08815, partial [Chitinophagales bacterium]
MLVSKSLGCESTYSIPVSIADIPSAVLNVEPAVGCGTLNSTYTILTSTADSIFLNTGIGSVYLTSSSISIPYNTPGIYTPTALLINTSGCSATIDDIDSIIVSYAPEAIMSLSDSMPFCSGEEILIQNLSLDTVTNPLINPIDNYTVIVNGTTIYSDAEMEDAPFNLITAGDYWITLITSNSLGCLDSTSTLITVHASPDAIAGADETICPGSNLILDGTSSVGGTTYVWSPPGLFINNTVPQPIGYFGTSTMVYLEYSNDFCSDTDSIFVNVVADLQLQAWPDTAICMGESVQIHAISDAGGNPVNLVWLDGNYLSSTIIPDPVATPLNTITYTVAATCGDLIEYEDVTIVVNTLPSVIASDTVYGYYGESINLSAVASGNAPFIYNWTPDEYLTCNNCQNTTASPTTETTYIVTVTDANNCT